MRNTTIFTLILISLLLSIGLLSAETVPPKEGEELPEITLSTTEVQTHQDYLGITKNKKTFRVTEIKADIILIEIFSMYCPYCQKDAPVVNELYSKISQDEKLKHKIKLIGIGAGNSPFGVDFFQKTYNVNFPLFSDGVSERALFFINKKGILSYAHVSDINKRPDLKDLDTELEKLNKN